MNALQLRSVSAAGMAVDVACRGAGARALRNGLSLAWRGVTPHSGVCHTSRQDPSPHLSLSWEDWYNGHAHCGS